MMTRFSSTLGTLINVLFTAGVFGGVMLAISSTI